jgi:parallel beta-helix repeat protein
VKERVLLVAGLIVLLTAGLFWALTVECIASIPRVWRVNDDGLADFRTIQEAVDAAGVGDIIYVCNGTYSEDITVSKALSIIGESRDSTIVRSSNVLSDVFTVTASDVLVVNLTIRDGICGVNALGQRVTVSSCKFPYNSIGSYLQGLNCSVLNSEFVRNDVGIDIFGSNSNVIMHNRIEQNNWIGISLEYGSASNVVKFNEISSNGYSSLSPDILGGVFLFDSVDNTFLCNNFVDNAIEVKDHSEGISANLWSEAFPIGGNYWSDYVTKYPNASEIDDSGIWATPYVINELNVDGHPLVNPIRGFDAVGLDGKQYVVSVTSNSTISGFRFESGDKPSITFAVAGASGTTGSCGVTIPKGLLPAEKGWHVTIDGETINCTPISTESFTYLHFGYDHSSKVVVIKEEEVVPEFGFLTALLLLMTATTLAIASRRRRRLNLQKTV